MDYREVLKSNTVLDRKYRIDRVIGAGGFGITYQAFDIGLAAPVAVKEYYPAQFGMRDTSLSIRARSESDRPLFDRLKASFLREARTLAQFDHPAIVRVLSVFEAHGTAYMVMRFESGPSLKAWLRDNEDAPSQADLDRLIWPLLDAIELMHRADFLHRDIAPDNIIVRADGGPVLLDFGASRRVITDMSGTLTGVVKQGYSPQEQYSSDVRAQGPWTDIYSLGATLYLAVTGKVPAEATARMLDDGMKPALEAARGSYRAEFLAAIDEALRLHPRNRPQSVAEWREMLFLGAGPTAALLEPGSGLLGRRSGPTAGRTGETTPRSAPQSGPGPRDRNARSTPTPNSTPSARPSLERQPSQPLAGSQPVSGAAINGSQSIPISAPTASMGEKAADFALSTKGAVVLGVAAMLLGGGMLLAFEPSNRVNTIRPPIGDLTTPGGTQQASLQIDAERQRTEAQRKAKEDADRAAAEAQRREADRLAALQRQQEADRQRAEAQRKAQEDADRAAAEAQRREAERLAALQRQQEADRQRAEAQRQADEQQRRAAAAAAALSGVAPLRQIAFTDPQSGAGAFAQKIAVSREMVLAGGMDGQIRLWNPSSNQIAGFAQRQAGAVSALAVGQGEERVATGSWTGDVVIWDAANGAQLRTVQGPRTPVVALSYRTQNRINALHSDGTWRILNPEDGQTLMTSSKRKAYQVTSAQFTADGRTVFAAVSDGPGQHTIKGWTPADGGVTREAGEFAGHTDWIYGIAVSPDGQTLVSASADRTVRVWSVATRREIRRLDVPDGHVRTIAFSADGSLIATGGDAGMVDVWRTATGARVARLAGASGTLRSVAFIGGNTTLAAAGDDGAIRQWAVSVQ